MTSTSPFRRLPVLGVGVDVVTTDEVLHAIQERVRDRQSLRIVTVNAEYVMRAQRDERFYSVLAEADLATPDGFGVVWALRRAGADVPDRVGGSDLVWQIPEQAARCGHRLFLLGAGPGVAREAARVLQERHGGLQVAGTFEGSPDQGERQHIVDLIRRSRADILFVCFGAPQQDIWIAENLMETGAVVGIGMGGSLDYVAGRARRAPMWMRSHGLEWLWRLIRQPWRLRRMTTLPQFALRVLAESAGRPQRMDR